MDLGSMFLYVPIEQYVLHIYAVLSLDSSKCHVLFNLTNCLA